MLLILQRPEMHGSLEGSELDTCNEEEKDISFVLGPFQWFPFAIRMT